MPPSGLPFFKRRRWTEQDAENALAALRESGKPVSVFAAEHGIDSQRLYSWRRRLAEQERARLIERTKAGLESARRRGAKIGRPRRRVDLERARELRAEGRTLRQVAAELGVGAATLHRALANVAMTAASSGAVGA